MKFNLLQESKNNVKLNQNRDSREGKENYLEKDLRILRKIQNRKKFYIDEYRKILLNRKNINLDSNLPRIKYVKQNDLCKDIDSQHLRKF